MEAIEPAYGTVTLLIIAALAVAVLLFLIITVKMHAFVALVLVSVLTALAAGIPVGKIPDAMMYGFADTLGSVALLVGFGVMIGRILEVTGGAQVLADTLISRFGQKRAPFALGVAALIFGFPIFFDAGLVIFLPIIYTVGRRFGGSMLYYALPAAGAFAAMHAIVPPHPGPVAAGQALGANTGITLLVGIPIAILSWYVGSYLVSRFLGKRIDLPISDVIFGEINTGGAGTGGGDDDTGDGGTVQTRPAPSFGTVLSLLLLPLVLIACNTVLSTLVTTETIAEGHTVVDLFILIGNTPVALLITVLVCVYVLGIRGRTMSQVSSLLDSSLGPVCSIILITGAGGMFGGILELSGIGSALSGSLSDLGISLILQAFVISAILRVAQGSATVALTTAAGLLAPAASAGDLSNFQLTLLVVAIAAGATVLSHVNDSGFWLVNRFFDMDVKTTLKSWTVMETTLGLSAFVISAILWAIV